MVFSSLFFVFFFLCASYGAYFCLGKTLKAKNIILLVSSLIFYAWGGPALLILLCTMTFICYCGALILDGFSGKKRKAVLISTVVLSLSILVLFKYTGFFLSQIKGIFSLQFDIPEIVLPIGISFYTFQLISYVVDVYRKKVEAQKRYWILLLYASLFHQCIAGPIVRYADVCNDIENRRVNMSEVADGFGRFAVGLAKKAILANGCAVIADKLLPATESMAESSTLSIIVGAIAFSLQIYLDFSAYSDMAIGMGLMVGFHYCENFNYPYTATSVTDFWRRWHISLSSFFRDYVYIPLGGNRCSVPRHILNLFVVWGLTGLWHGASWNFVLWGLYFFLFLVFEKYIFKPQRFEKVWQRALLHLYLTAIVCFGFMIFRFEDLSNLGSALSGMFSFKTGFADKVVTTTVLNDLFLLTVSVVACTPVIPKLKALIMSTKDRNPLSRVAYAVSSVIPALLIILSALALVGNSYNPFLYFQF